MMTDEQRESVRGEVEDSDVYRMRDRANIVSCNDPNYVHEYGHQRHFNFEPTLIFDLGANVGTFSRYCHKLFPKARIVAVEPNEWNCDEFRKDMPDNTTLIQAAIGTGQTVYHVNNEYANSTGHCYLSAGLGYKAEQMEACVVEGYMSAVKVDSIRFADLKKYVKPNDKIVVKMDIEGAENSIFGDPESLAFLKEADYFTAEVHFFAHTHEQVNEVTQVTESVFKSFEQTHICKRYGIFFHATKK